MGRDRAATDGRIGSHETIEGAAFETPQSI
jgi:hypothetical protein